MVMVNALGGMGGYAQYGVGSRVGPDPYQQGDEPEAQIQVGIFSGDPLSEVQFKAVVVHEMGHVLNDIHEHERPDRDSGVCETTTGEGGGPLPITYGGVYVTEPYDPDSIMNYCRDLDDDGQGDGYTEDVSEQLTATDIAGTQAIYSFPDEIIDDSVYFCTGTTATLLAGDVNGDGRSDAICNDTATGVLSVRLAAPDGTVGTPVNALRYFCNDADSEIFALDLNGNNRDDLLCRNKVTGWVEALFADEDGTYKDDVAWRGPFAKWCAGADNKIIVGNFNGDERDDLMCLTPIGRVQIQISLLPEFPADLAPPNHCTEAGALDLDAPGTAVTVPADGCIRVRDGYPYWWGTRTMQLQIMEPGTYPIPYTWSNTCSGGSGGGTINSNWQSEFLNPTSRACATVIDLGGTPGTTVKLRYYGM